MSGSIQGECDRLWCVLFERKRVYLGGKLFRIRYRVLSLLLILGILLLCIPSAIAQGEEVITIYHTNDIHGRVDSTYSVSGQLTQIGADVLKNVKDQTPNSILIDAGDPTQGATIATYSQGEVIIEMMNAAGYDGMTLGNHEFDYGPDVLKQNVEKAEFPVVSANTRLADTGAPFLKDINGSNGCNFIKEIAGKKIGFFGIITEETAYKTNPKNVIGVSFLDPLETSKQQIKELREQGVDAVIGIMHIGITESEVLNSRELAQNLEGIDAIIDGHSHSQVSEEVNGVKLQQTGSGAKNLGKIEIKFASDGSVMVHQKLMSASEVGTEFTANPEVTELYNQFYEAQRPLLEKIIAKTESPLYAGTYEGKSIARAGETNLGSLTADAMLWAGKQFIADDDLFQDKNIPAVSLENGGAIRETLEAGYITKENIAEVFPSGNCISMKEITPKQLYATLESGVCRLKAPVSKGEALTGEDGKYPQIAGMRFEMDLSKIPYNAQNPGTNEGERVTKVVLLNEDGTDQRELLRTDESTKIVLVSSDFITSGGDGYDILKTFPSVGEGDVLEKVFTDYLTHLVLTNGKAISYPFFQNRSSILKSEELYGAYDGILWVNKGADPLVSETVTITLDDQPANLLQTDEEGKIELKELTSGPHNIRISYDGMAADVYLNELNGLKHGTAVLEDKSQQQIEQTIKLIDQISEQTEESAAFVKFVRSCYDSLPELSKDQVTNSAKLVEAEKSLGNTDQNSEHRNQEAFGIQWMIVIGLSTLVVIISVVTVIIYRKKKS